MINKVQKHQIWPAFLAATLLAFHPGPSSATIVDGVAVKINEEIITISDVQQRVDEVAKVKSLTSPDELKKAEESILERMIEDKLLLYRAKELGVSAEEKDIDQAIADVKKKNNATDEQFKAMLERNGFTYEKYRQEIKEQIIISKVTGMDIRSQINNSGKEIKDYYEANKHEFAEPEEIKASHILIAFRKGEPEEKAKRKAQEVYQRLKKGEEFASLARLYSDDGTSTDGGNLGFFKRGMMVSKFEEAAFKLRVGEVGEPVQTQFGWHIIKVTDRKEPKPHSFEEARASIEEKLSQDKFKKKYKELINSLKAKNFVEILHGPASLALPEKPEKGKENEKPVKTKREEPTKKDERDISELIKEIILKWKKSVEQEDFNEYESCYSSNFNSGQEDKNQWMKQAREMFRANDKIQTDIRDVRALKKDDLYVATFGQEFTSGQEHSLYERRFYLRMEDDKMKITGEKWIKKKPDFEAFSTKPLLTSKTKISILDTLQ
ncbi:MAG: peptidylprolyl isomerase [Nitrospinae bacterium]|nr:peptidylprolyl isomerase [Nitrospinota bacterium]